jgi:DUF4097 and DUF4098 domain-containing protein YvlB
LQLDVQIPVGTEDLTIRTASGDITLEEYQGANLTVNTATGTVEVENVQADTSIQTVTGPIELKMNTLKQDVDLQTNSGDLKVSLPDTASFSMTIESPTNKPDIEFDLRDEHQQQDTLSGTVGQGGPLLNMKTQTGHIKLQKK